MESWMSKLPDENLYILTNFPCTHDSSAYHMNKIGSCYSKTQNLDYKGQLSIGIRHFDIRVTKKSCFNCFFNFSRKSEEQACEDIITCHGICDCYFYNDYCSSRKLTLKDVLLTFRKFLEENPSEGIFINLQNGRGDKQVNMPRALEIFEKICGDISLQMDKKLKIKDIRGKIICSPVLEENDYIKMHKMKPAKLYRRLQGGYGLEEIHKNYAKYSTFKVGGELKVKEVKELLDKYEMSIDDAKENEKKNNNNFPINYSVSCTGEHDSILPYPKTQAVIVNNFFRQRIFKKGFYYGWINFDFITEDIAKKIINTNNLSDELEESVSTNEFLNT